MQKSSIMRAAIYCRLSKEDKINTESESIVNQKNMLTDYAEKCGFTIYRIYADDDYSGANINRPEFRKLLKDAEEKKFDIILCKSQSRFSRDISVIEEYLHTKFPLWGIRFISLIDNADTEQKSNKKARQINSLINEWYLEDLSENIRAVFKTKMMRGEFLAAFAPYGYKKDERRKNHLVPDENVKDVVSFIFTSHIKGFGNTKIARELNEKGICTPSAYRRQNGLPTNGKVAPLWSASTVSAILKNPVYYGHTVQNVTSRASFKSTKKIKNPKNEWIIVQNTHDALSQGLLYQAPTRRRALAEGEPNFLSGKVFCFECGMPMHRVNTKTKAAKKITYLRCQRRYIVEKSSRCSCPSIRADELENEAYIKAKEIIHRYKSDEELKKLLLSKKTTVPETYDVSAEINRLDKALESLYLDKASGIITAEQFLKFSENFKEKKASLLKAKEPSLDNTINFDEAFDEFIKLFIGHTLEKIVISKNDKYESVAEFYWKGLS